MSSNQMAELSQTISNLEISEEPEEEEKKALQKTLTLSYMHAHEPFATLPPQYRVRRSFRPIPPKFVYGLGVPFDELIPLAVKVQLDYDDEVDDPMDTLRDYFECICGQRPTLECVYSRNNAFVLGLATTYSMTQINEARVIAARDKIQAELARLKWPDTKCMWFIAAANNLGREDWYNPDPEYDSECPKALINPPLPA